jgi:hypothetical protein
MSIPEKPPREPVADPHPQLKPHPRLFKALCLIFALWMAVLLALYFLTVYPLRHPTGNGAAPPTLPGQ